MKKKSVNNSQYDSCLNALIDRISSFTCSQLGISVWDTVNGSYERMVLKNPADLRYNLEVCDTSCDALYAFTSRMPELSKKIYSAHKDTPIKITLEADLSDGMVYTVMCLIDPECGMTNVTIDNDLRVEALNDPLYPRIYGDFFLGDKNAA